MSLLLFGLEDDNETKVLFPFKEPYGIQKTYMQKVIQCLDLKQNALLESPTGTGKTMSLLCASLAWLAKRKMQAIENNTWGKDSESGGPPKIFYTSRTHSQLGQAIAELKRTEYTSMKSTIIGSREQLCIHEHVSKLDSTFAKVHACRAKTRTHSCMYANNVEKKKEYFSGIMDIEDLVSTGKKHCACPYYAAQDLANEADMIFMPYNYILDPSIRKVNKVEIRNNVIIFDEAHNLASICEDSSSTSISDLEIGGAINEIASLLETMMANDKIIPIGETDPDAPADFQLEDIIKIKEHLHNFEDAFNEIKIPQGGINEPGSYVFGLFNKWGLTVENHGGFVNMLDSIVSHLNNSDESNINSKALNLTKLCEALKVMYVGSLHSNTLDQFYNEIDKYYRININLVKTGNDFQDGSDIWKRKSKILEAKTINYWCFSSGYSMNQLYSLGVHSLILTSGTLQPMDAVCEDMRVDFGVQLVNNHIINPSQTMVSVMKIGNDREIMLTDYNNRSKDSYKTSFGRSVIDIAKATPGGILIFFSSYPVMNDIIKHWKNNEIMDELKRIKPFFCECKSKKDFSLQMSGYNDSILSGAGGIFTGVCRGKVAEGLDFANNFGRLVIMACIPYAPRNDPKTVNKMLYLDDQKRKGIAKFDGNRWYQLQAMTAVNQAIGRVIRHKFDYGAIMFADRRFSEARNNSFLPKWIGNQLQAYDDFNVLLRKLRNFYALMRGNKIIQQESMKQQINITKPIPISKAKEIIAKPIKRKKINIIKKSKLSVSLEKDFQEENDLPQSKKHCPDNLHETDSVQPEKEKDSPKENCICCKQTKSLLICPCQHIVCLKCLAIILKKSSPSNCPSCFKSFSKKQLKKYPQ